MTSRAWLPSIPYLMVASLLACPAFAASPLEDRVAELISALDDEQFSVRESAGRAVAEMGVTAVSQLQVAAQSAASPEVRFRAAELLRLIEVRQLPNLIQQLRGHTGYITMVAFSPDGDSLASAGEDSVANVWRWKDSQVQHALKGHASGLLLLTYAPDGKALATCGRDGKVILWNPASGEALITLSDHQGAVSAAGFSPDGRLFVTGGDDRVLRVRDSKGALQFVLEGHRKPIIALSVSADGKTLYRAGGEWGNPRSGGELHAWNLTERKRLWSAKGDFGGLWSVCAVAEAGRVATAGLDGVVRLWDQASGEQIAALNGHTNRVIWVAAMPNQSVIASASYDGTVRLWNAKTGKALGILAAHPEGVQRLSFSGDGRRMVTSGNDLTIKVSEIAGSSLTGADRASTRPATFAMRLFKSRHP